MRRLLLGTKSPGALSLLAIHKSGAVASDSWGVEEGKAVFLYEKSRGRKLSKEETDSKRD
jgi:hypothetical protein